MNRFKNFILLILVLSFAVSCQPSKYQFPNPDGRPLSSFKATGNSAMIATADKYASKAGLEILKNGGTAMDAAIAISFAISVTRPQSTGLGGGGFMLVYDAKNKKTEVFDFRERAPIKASRDMYIKDGKVVPGLSVYGYKAVAVPGTVAGLIEVHKKHATFPLKDLIAPAIKLAKKGFPLYPELARKLEGKAERISQNPAMKKIFFKDGRPLKEGELLVQTDLSKTLESIAKYGRAGFYDGWVAKAIAEDMQKNGGLVTQQDLKNYRVKTRDPIRGTYRGYEIVSMPPPSSGGIHVVQMLNVLEGYDLKSSGFKSPKTTHLLAESMRQAFADRAYFLGDPDFINVPIKELTSESYAEKTRKNISLSKANSSEKTSHGFFKPLESPSTTHFSVVDKHGNAVSSTQTVNYSFGASVVAAGTGIVLNDEMDDFSAMPGVPNIYSARYAGPTATDEENNQKLLEKAKELYGEDRNAYFQCVIAVVLPTGKEYTFEGRVDGRLMIEPKGDLGFGYDPIFFVPALKKTMAELSPEEKSAISHRGMALKALLGKLPDYL